MGDERKNPTVEPGWWKWRRRWESVLNADWERRVQLEAQPSTIIIKGDAAFQILNAIFVKGNTVFASDAVFIKGDSDLIGELSTIIKGDTQFFRTAVYIKGDASLAVNIFLPDLGENPADTKPGAISRIWLQVKAVTKDVT
jgi:hypothetical protein